MKRPAIILAMLIALLWQSVAMARIGSMVNPLLDLEHATLHWQETAHHHDDDGSLHLDESRESVQHVAIDHLNASLDMGAQTAHGLLPLGSATPNGLQRQAVPNPALDGLLRPPRFWA
jgi:hypothetical protein